MFVDDRKITNLEPVKGDQVQHDLDNLQTWSEEWQLRFNESKCNTMHLGNQQDPRVYHVKPGCEMFNLENCSVKKDLRVM